MTQFRDGSAGDADYAEIGITYRDYRRADPRIEALINEALGQARSVLNVGAGAGSYEPHDRDVTAVEPSVTMRALRPAELPKAVDARAESLPFEDDSFDAAMSTYSIHQWSDLNRGLTEMRRVTTGPIVLLTCDPAKVRDFWLYDYAPEVLEVEARRYPSLEDIANILGPLRVDQVPIPADCTDGFNEAYFARPEVLLEPGARNACSAWSFVGPEVHERFTTRLRADLVTGVWDARYGALRSDPFYFGSLVLVVARCR
jgi:SAM-dependent methyltransferase